MAHVFPGAVWRPMPGQEKRAKRRKGRGAIFHVAVFRGRSIYSINLGTGNDAHLYVRKDGSVEQNIDLDLVAYAAVDANPTMVMVETEGGMGTSAQVNAEPWTPEQAETLAQIAAYLNRTEGAPLQVMADSRPSSRGIAVHRWGITPWRVVGGEKWSGVNGKECPGNAKIAQVPAIVARGQQIVDGRTAAAATPPLIAEDDDMKVIKAPGRGAALVGPGYYRQLLDDEDYESAKLLYGDPHEDNARRFDVWVSQSVNGQGASSTTAALTGLAAQVAGIKPADVDEEALAALLAPKLNGSSQAEITAALREVLRAGVGA